MVIFDSAVAHPVVKLIFNSSEFFKWGGAPFRGGSSSRGVSVQRGSPSRRGSLSRGQVFLTPVNKPTLLKTLPSLTVGKNEEILEFIKFRNLGAKFVIRDWHEVYFCNAHIILNSPHESFVFALTCSFKQYISRVDTLSGLMIVEGH